MRKCVEIFVFRCAEERVQHSALDDKTLSSIASNLMMGPWLLEDALSVKTKNAVLMVNNMAGHDVAPRADRKRNIAMLQLLTSESAALLGDEENTRHINRLVAELLGDCTNDDSALLWRLCHDYVKSDALDSQLLTSLLLRNVCLLHNLLEDNFIQQLRCEESISPWSRQIISAIATNRDIFLASLEFGFSYLEELDMDPRFLNVLKGFLVEVRLSCGDSYARLFPEDVQGLVVLMATKPDDINLERNPSYALALIEAASIVRSENRQPLVALLFLVHIKWFRKLLQYSAMVDGKFHVQWLSNFFSINDICRDCNGYDLTG